MGEILGLIVFIGFPAIVVVAALVVLFRVFVMPAIANSGEKKKLITTDTKVISKRENLIGAGVGEATVYYVMFEDCLELRVPHKIYDKVNAGDTVRLTYAGEKFEELYVLDESKEKSITKIKNTVYFTDTDKTRQAR